MFCTTCGKKLSDNAMFCSYCGTSVNMKRREDISAEQSQVSQSESQPVPPQVSQSESQPVPPQVSQSESQPVPPQDSQALTQPVQMQDSQPLVSPVQMQVPQPITLPQPPQISQPEPQLSQPQGFQPGLQPTQPQASQSIPQPVHPQGYQPVQNPRVQYVARPAGAPVPGVTEAPKKKRGWIVPVVLIAVVVVAGISYLGYLAMVAYLRDVMDTAYREQYHEWNSNDYDTGRPWNVPGFSQDEPDNSDDIYNSEELFPSDEDNDQDGDAEEDVNVQPDQPDWNEGNGSNDNNPGDDVYAYDGSGIGYVGDIMHAYWFDFTVNNVLFCQSFQGYSAREGYQLIVLDMTIENTFEEEVPMFDTDFWVEWEENDSDFDYSYPVSNSYDISHDFLQEHYYLHTNDIITGLLMYEVPVGASEYMLIFEEYFEDGDVGDWFGVYLYADAGPNIHTL